MNVGEDNGPKENRTLSDMNDCKWGGNPGTMKQLDDETVGSHGHSLQYGGNNCPTESSAMAKGNVSAADTEKPSNEISGSSNDDDSCSSPETKKSFDESSGSSNDDKSSFSADTKKSSDESNGSSNDDESSSSADSKESQDDSKESLDERNESSDSVESAQEIPYPRRICESDDDEQLGEMKHDRKKIHETDVEFDDGSSDVIADDNINGDDFSEANVDDDIDGLETFTNGLGLDMKKKRFHTVMETSKK